MKNTPRIATLSEHWTRTGQIRYIYGEKNETTSFRMLCELSQMDINPFMYMNANITGYYLQHGRCCCQYGLVPTCAIVILLFFKWIETSLSFFEWPLFPVAGPKLAINYIWEETNANAEPHGTRMKWTLEIEWTIIDKTFCELILYFPYLFCVHWQPLHRRCLILLQNANQFGNFIADGIGRINEIAK